MLLSVRPHDKNSGLYFPIGSEQLVTEYMITIDDHAKDSGPRKA